ncbi:MAG: MFS transporter [Armatimonadetes bacterium]|nr:MFS transporter [Armatimonadota bacterium]
MPSSTIRSSREETAFFSRRNFAVGIVNGALYIASAALIDPDTVLPAYALDVSGTVLGVGLIAAAISAGWNWPPVLLIGLMERTRRWMLYYRLTAVLRIACAWLLVPVAFHSRHNQPAYLWLMAGLLLAMTSAGGAASIPFLSTVGETIPPTLRGRFFGIRFLIGGLLSLGAGAFVKHMLSPAGRAMFPANYGYLFFGSAVLATLSLASFCAAEERPKTVLKRGLPPLAQLRRGGRLIRRDPDYRQLLVARVLLGLTAGLFIPFIVPYALRRLHLDPAAIGLLMPAGVLGYSLSNVIWSYLSDGPGNRVLLVVSGVCYLLVPALVLTAGHLSSQATGQWLGIPTSPAFWALLITFVLLGTARAGQDLGHTNYLLELSPGRHYPAYFAFYALAGVPLSLLPLAGAVIIGKRGNYEAGFLAALALLGAMLWVLRGLREVRKAENGNGGEG